MLQRPWLSVAIGSVAVAGIMYSVWQVQHRAPTLARVDQINILQREDFLDILRKIRVAYSERNGQLLRSFRHLRRGEERGSNKYKSYIKEMMLATKETLKQVSRQILQENNVSKEILDASKNHYDDDSEIKSALRRMCTPLPKECSLGTDVLKDILQFYLSRLNEMECRDADELAVSMQILADDLFDEFGYEAEEIEYASVNSDPRVQQLVMKIRAKTEELMNDAVMAYSVAD